jgi:hypothetical protein
MPCGGIGGNLFQGNPTDSCLQCGKTGGPFLFVEEWDGGVHRHCIAAFLASPDGLIVLDHGHEIVIPAESNARAQELPESWRDIIDPPMPPTPATKILVSRARLSRFFVQTLLLGLFVGYVLGCASWLLGMLSRTR